MIVSRWSRRRGSLDRGEEEILSRSGAIFSDTLFYCCFFPRRGSTAEVPQGATWLGWRVTRGIRIGLNRGVMLVSGWQMAVRISAIS